MKRSAAVIAALLLLAPGAPAQAWNYAGHMIVAKIAWTKLSPEEREKVSLVLKHHPHYATHLAANKPPDVDQDEWVFLRAATWPDLVRSPKGYSAERVAAHPVYRFHRGPWHYVDYPYRAGEAIGEKLPAPLPAETDILRQLPLSIDVAKGAADDPGRLPDVSPAANRAVRICWLLHLVGDLHQPLHTTALVDPRVFPDGQHDDQGGNLIAVRAAAGGKPLRLHSYWDGLLGSDARHESVSKLARELLDDPALAPGELPELAHATIEAWTRESHEHAVQTVYLDGKLPVVSYDDFAEGKIAAADVPVLPEEAQQSARRLARRRVLLAGLRIARHVAEISPRAERDGDPAIGKEDVFTAGEGGYASYRIPSMVVTPNGVVLLFCEGRKTGRSDDGDIDLLLRRSDGGRKWLSVQLVHEEGGDAPIKFGNPCAVVDRETGAIWLTMNRSAGATRGLPARPACSAIRSPATVKRAASCLPTRPANRATTSPFASATTKAAPGR